MSVIKFKPKSNTQLSQHFNSNEFDCPCGKCSENFIDMKLIDKLEALRIKYGSPLKLTSGYRCAQHNSEVGGVSNSAHGNGLAADIQPGIINVDELDKLYNLAYDMFDNIGDGRKLRFIHIDIRSKKPDGSKRTWTY